jgi:ABC-type multidrug transport system ATPase subunit
MSLVPVVPLEPGLVAVTGEEGAGKTRLLRWLAGDPVAQPGQGQLPDALWLDLALPGQDELTPHQVWDALQQRCPRWDPMLEKDLAQALGLEPHLAKKLSMLSTGSRRKVALVGLLASGATVTCLDQPFAALDAGSAGVVRDFLAEAAEHATRTWVVADYQADSRLRWRRHIVLPDGGAHRPAM